MIRVNLLCVVRIGLIRDFLCVCACCRRVVLGLMRLMVVFFCGFVCLLVEELTVSTSLIMMSLDPVKSGF